MPAALDRIYRIYRILLGLSIHFWPRKDAKLKSMISFQLVDNLRNAENPYFLIPSPHFIHNSKFNILNSSVALTLLVLLFEVRGRVQKDQGRRR